MVIAPAAQRRALPVRPSASLAIKRYCNLSMTLTLENLLLLLWGFAYSNSGVKLTSSPPTGASRTFVICVISRSTTVDAKGKIKF